MHPKPFQEFRRPVMQSRRVKQKCSWLVFGIIKTLSRTDHAQHKTVMQGKDVDTCESKILLILNISYMMNLPKGRIT